MTRLVTIALVCALCVATLCVVPAVAGPGADTPETTRLWEIVRHGDTGSLQGWLQTSPDLINLRAADGRGALWWAYEFGRLDMVELLLAAGANADDTDVHGNTPSSLLNKGAAPPRPAAPEPDDEDEEDEDEEDEKEEL